MKKSSYQKLKDENLKLKQDIYKLVMCDDKKATAKEILDAFGVRMVWRMRFELENIVWK